MTKTTLPPLVRSIDKPNNKYQRLRVFAEVCDCGQVARFGAYERAIPLGCRIEPERHPCRIIGDTTTTATVIGVDVDPYAPLPSREEALAMAALLR